MRVLLAVSICVVAIVISYGCSDDDCNPCEPCVVPEQPLAQLQRDAAGGTSGGFDTLRIVVLYTASADTIVDLLVTEDDEGSSITITSANNPDFDEAVARLTNGTDETITMWTFTYPGGGGGGLGSQESYFLKGGFSGDFTPDLAGANVTEAVIHLDDILIDNQGSMTDYETEYRVVFMGRP